MFSIRNTIITCLLSVILGSLLASTNATFIQVLAISTSSSLMAFFGYKK